MSDLDTLARQLYERCAPVAPTWDQLSDTTRDVWREKAQAQLYGDIA